MGQWLERYQSGEHQAVWAELRAGRGQADAEVVVCETFRRVRRNLETVVQRLTADGYRFIAVPLYPPLEPREFENEISAMREVIGAQPPLALRSFWSLLGSVDLRGSYPGWAGTTWASEGDPRPCWLSDALVINPPSANWAQSRFDEWTDAWAGEGGAPPFSLGIGPDAHHKANISGSDGPGIVLPSDWLEGKIGAPGQSDVPFVDFLRASLKWAGFPGLHAYSETHADLRRWASGLDDF